MFIIVFVMNLFVLLGLYFKSFLVKKNCKIEVIFIIDFLIIFIFNINN